MKKIFCSCFMLLLCLVLLTSAYGGDQVRTEKKATRTITDMAGVRVQVPINIERIADSWRAHNEVLCMLGAGKKIVATVLAQSMSPWLYQVNPQMHNAVVCFTADVNMEELIKSDPDIIILMSSASKADQLFTDPLWAKVPAVKNGKVFRNPEGAFPWDRYSAEEAMQIQWAAKTLHPDEFQDLDLVKETKHFYATFMDYSLTTEEAERILGGLPPL